MKRNLSRWVLAATLLIATAKASALESCDVCKKPLTGTYFTYADEQMCSEECVDKRRPKCNICRKRIRGKYLEAKGKIYCGETCYETSLPKCSICHKPCKEWAEYSTGKVCMACEDANPPCFSCNRPAPPQKTLPDGRNICSYCVRWGVSTPEHAAKHYDLARRQIEAWSTLKIQSLPELKLIGQDEMLARSGTLRKTPDKMAARGLYSRQTTITTKVWGFWFHRKKEKTLDEKEAIYVLDYLSDSSFRVTAAHELMHDLIFEYFPNLEEAPLWVHEGICQFAAAEVCRRRHYTEILYSIEHNKDPDYGDGYRYIKQVSGRDGWHQLKKWMENIDAKTLPKKAPRILGTP